MLELILWLWVAWIAFNVSAFAGSIIFLKPQHPQFNGVRVHIPEEWLLKLTEDELHAVIMHEHGHRAHLHVWKNLLRLFFFVPMTARRRVRQELQADDYATNPFALASALRKMSSDPFDLLRAVRLEAKAVPEPGRPYARDARSAPPMGEVK